MSDCITPVKEQYFSATQKKDFLQMKKTLFSLVASLIAVQSAQSFACAQWKSVCTKVEDGVCMEWTSQCVSGGKGEGGGTVEPNPPKGGGGEKSAMMRAVSPVTFPFIFSEAPKDAREIEITIDEETGEQQVRVLK